jgi:putative flippase GtrA
MRFVLAGGPGVLLYYAVFYALTYMFGTWYLASSVVASFANQACNFGLQKFWTFRNMDVTVMGTQARNYAAMAATMFLANLGLLFLLVDSLGLRPLTAQLMATAMLTVASYFMTSKIFAPPAHK